MRRTKIVATVGPASRDPKVLERLVNAGVNVFRLNFSHGTHEEHLEVMKSVREIAARTGKAIALHVQLKAPARGQKLTYRPRQYVLARPASATP